MAWDYVKDWLSKSGTAGEEGGTARMPHIEEAVTTLRAVQAVDGPDPPDPRTQPLESVRLLPERELLDALFERYALDEILESFEEQGGAQPHYDLILATHLRLTDILSPRLAGLFGEVRERLRFKTPVDLFVGGDADMNAFALDSPGGEYPQVVALTSGTVERMNDDELRFVLGHELGHLHYRHYRARMVEVALDDGEGGTRMPALLQRRLESWDRLAEISADRAGFIAAGESLDTAVSTFFKLTAGLGPEHLQFDIVAFLEQLESLQGMQRGEVLSKFSHPATPVRVRALQLFSEARTEGRWPADRDELDAQVMELARLMDFEVTRPEEIRARDFLISGGLLAAYADDKGVTDDQYQLLIEILLPLASDPERTIAELSSAEEAQEMLLSSAAWLRDNAGEERFRLFSALAHLTCLDGELHPAEKEFLLHVAELLGIPEKSATRSMYEILQSYLKERATRRRQWFRK